MKKSFLIWMLFVALSTTLVFSQQVQGPLSKGQVSDLVKSGLEPSNLAKLIREHGIDFDLTEDYLQALRQAGAPDPVIQALRATRPQPLSKEQVLKYVGAGYPSQLVSLRVKQRGVSFLADEEFFKTLRLLGMDDTVVAAVREASAEAASQLVVLTSANADVYLDSQPLGHANGQGQLAAAAAAGTHSLKVTLSGKKDFEQSITLAARQTTKIEARLEDSAPGSDGQFHFPAAPKMPPLAMEALMKYRECIAMYGAWNGQVGYPQTRGQANVLPNSINQEHAAIYRTNLLPGLKDLQQKLLQEVGRPPNGSLDYGMVRTNADLLTVCQDFQSLTAAYDMKAPPYGSPLTYAPTGNPGLKPADQQLPANDPNPVTSAPTQGVVTRQSVTPASGPENPPGSKPVAGISELKSTSGSLESLPQIWRNVATNDLYRIRFDAEHLIIFQIKSNQVVADLTLKKGKYAGTTSISPCQGGGHMEVASWSATRIEAKVEVPDPTNKVCGGFGGFGHSMGRSMTEASFIPEAR